MAGENGNVAQGAKNVRKRKIVSSVSTSDTDVSTSASSVAFGSGSVTLTTAQISTSSIVLHDL